MTKIMVASFKDEEKAMNAYKKLNELESLGDISLYDKIIVRKKGTGSYETLKSNSGGNWREVGSMAVGGLLGAIGGPIGLLIGIYVGVTIGVISEIKHFDFEADFIKNVEGTVPTSTVTIFAEIDEEDKDFVEMYLLPFDAVIWKSNVHYASDDYIIGKIQEIEDQITEQRNKVKNSTGKEKEKIEEKITALKEKRKDKLVVSNAQIQIASKDLQHTDILNS